MESKVEKAVENFKSGYSCSQVVVLTYCEDFGLSRESGLKISSGFGGGMGRMGEVCGAAAGAFMILGLKFMSMSEDNVISKAKVYEKVREFVRRFEERNGCIRCRDLLGCDISTPHGFDEAKEKDLFKKVCTGLVRDSAEILEEMF